VDRGATSAATHAHATGAAAPAASTEKSTNAAQGTSTGATGATTPKPSPQEVAANLANAEAAVASAKLTVESDQVALNGTKLYATSSGTVASISGQVGSEVTAGSAGSSGNGSSGTGASGAQGSSASAFASSASSASSDPSSSATGFIVAADLNRMQLEVSVSESDIGSVHVGQPATVTVDALPSMEFAAKVTSISVLPTSSSGVVSYDVTLQLTQTSSQLRAGMSASATIVTGQVTGAVTVDSAAISSRGTSSTVTLDDGGKMVVTPVISGLVGTNATQVVAGLQPGQQVVIPITTRLATAAGSTGAGSGTLGGGGLGGGAGLLGGGGGGGLGRFLRGGG
jgi:multidrug efflux pump subunit AcrA (membrane-fusion protein)